MASFDAVICPGDYPPGLDFVSRALARNKEFGGPAVLGAARVHSRAIPGNRDLVTREAADVTEKHPEWHALAGQPRYDWVDRGDGVLYGVLTDAARAAAPAPGAAAPAHAPHVLAALAAKKAAMAAQIDALNAVAPGARTADQSAALAKLTEWFTRLYPEG